MASTVPSEEQGNIFGNGVPQDSVEAAEWFRKAAEQGDAYAQWRIGVMYRNGEGVPKNSVKAAEWFRKAAEQGDADAQWRLGFAYAHGEGVPKDKVQAYMYYSLASATNSDVAELRDILAKRMTGDQIAKAQRLTREWKPTVQPK